MPEFCRQLADLSSNYEILSCIPIGRMSSGMPGCSRQLISALTSTTPTATTYPTAFSTTSGTKLINFFAKSQESLVLLKQDFLYSYFLVSFFYTIFYLLLRLIILHRKVIPRYLATLWKSYFSGMYIVQEPKINLYCPKISVGHIFTPRG